ncbi:MAG: DNA-binding protein Alba [Candidatus Bathyarchaeota archaeon]|nr:DNA-binding protein Alba [Candidatus Bathyarchaeota archaeon]
MTETNVKSKQINDKKTRTQIPRDSVFIGSKPIMSYVTAVMMYFSGGMNELSVKARGNAISRAVDVVEVSRRRFLDNLTVGDITIGTDVLGEGGDTRNVSTMEINLKKSD